MEEKEEKLYMPAKINPKIEYLPNITSSELKAILIMAFFSVLISCLLYFLNKRGASFIVFVVGLTLSYFLGVKVPNENVSLLVFFGQALKFLKSQKYYEFRFYNKWEVFSEREDGKKEKNK